MNSIFSDTPKSAHKTTNTFRTVSGSVVIGAIAATPFAAAPPNFTITTRSESSFANVQAVAHPHKLGTGPDERSFIVATVLPATEYEAFTPYDESDLLYD